MKKYFTTEEDAIIIRDYSRRYMRDIAADLGRPWQSVQQRINLHIREGRLNRSDRYYHAPWTDADDEMLADLWGKHSDTGVASRLGRSVTACQIRAKRTLQQSRKQQFYTARNVADIFGVDSKLVRRWIDEGFLTGKRSLVRVGKNRAWRIDEDALVEFVTHRAWVYDRRRIDPLSYWRHLVDRVHLKDPWLTTAEAAAELGVSRHTVVRHIERTWLPARWTFGAGGHRPWRIRRADLTLFQPRHPIMLSLGSKPDQWRRLRVEKAS